MLKVFRAMHKAQRFGLHWGKQAHVHQMLGVVIVVAHASEIVRVVSHITLWHLLAAIALFAVWFLTQQGESAKELA